MLTGIPGKTGVVYTLDRETGEFLWATPTITQNVISGIDGATGAVSENAELVFTAQGQTVLACPHASGGKDWEAGAYSPLTNTMYMPLRNVCARMRASTFDDEEASQLYASRASLTTAHTCGYRRATVAARARFPVRTVDQSALFERCRGAVRACRGSGEAR